MKIKSEFIHVVLSGAIALVIVFFPVFIGEKIMWHNYTDCNELTPIGFAVTSIWLAVLYGLIVNTVYDFLKRYTDYV